VVVKREYTNKDEKDGYYGWLKLHY